MKQECVNVLKNMNIYFLENCCHFGNSNLIWDFIIPKNDGSYWMLECRSLGHCQRSLRSRPKVPSAGGQELFLIDDYKKEAYCHTRGYPLLIIYYDDMRSYETIIKNFLIENNIHYS